MGNRVLTENRAMYSKGKARYVRLKPAWWLAVALCLCIAGCQRVEHTSKMRPNFRIDSARQSTGADERVQFLVLHYTAEDFSASLATLTLEPVSAHYLIPARPTARDGVPTALRLVDESRRAWHAGESFWRGRTHLNDTSIGIEMENQGNHQTLVGLRATPYPPEQIALVIALSRDIIRRYHILPGNVIGHSDIAWRRKQDPGPLFPWRQLAAAGVGVWPDKQRINVFLAGRDPYAPVAMAGIMRRMANYGYDVSPDLPAALQHKAVAAFQMHFRPEDFRGQTDAETEAILDVLLEIRRTERGGG